MAKQEKPQSDTDKLVEKLREVFAKLSDGERELLHSRLMSGYCVTCAHKMEGGTCWNCFESHSDA